MKTVQLNLLAIFTLLVSTGVFSQNIENKILVTLNEIATKSIQIENGKILSKENQIQKLIEDNNIVSITQAFPTSKKESLQNVFEITCECDANDLLVEVAKSRGELITKAEIAPKLESLGLPNDYNSVFTQDYALDIIEAAGAWNITNGSDRIKIAITDSNYDLNHEEIEGKYSYVQPNLTNSNYDHGTAVAITAAGNTNNNLGKSSIGYNSDLMLYGMSYNNLLLASQNGAHIINASWAGGCSYSEYYQALIDEVLENGSVIIAAAGNGGTCGGPSNKVYPASYNGVISVSSVGPNKNHERFIGDPNSTHQHNDKVDIVAPGYDVALSIKNNIYTTGNGSSFASPYVSGTVGLMLAVNEDLNHCEVEYILKNTSLNVDSLNPNYLGQLGAGMLNAKSALELTSMFENTVVNHSINHHYLDPNGALFLDITSGADIIDFQYDYVNTTIYSDSLELRNYLITITYNTGCVYKQRYSISESEFFNDDSLLVLPVTLASFEVDVVNDEVVLDWKTVSESNSAYFTIEKTIDGKIWEQIGQVSAAGNSNSINYYQLTDSRPVNGLQYYRLIQTDLNGDSYDSDVLSVEFTKMYTNEITIYPNPSSGISSIKWETNDIEKIAVIDQSGRIISEIQPEEFTFLDASDYNTGIHYVQFMHTNGDVSIKKWIVQ